MFRFPLALSLLLVGCGGSGHAPHSTNEAATRAAPAGDDWASLSWEDRHDVMTFAVLPNMGRMFQRFRGSPAPDMTCRTCHGADAEKVAYRMPNGLAPLDPAHLPRADDPDPSRARLARFMIEEVTPAMADLLGKERDDRATHPATHPATSAVFGCFGCHPAMGAPR